MQFKLDGVNLGSAVTGAGPVYSYSWNTATAANGTHTLTAVASDAAGNTAVSASVSVTVNNDTTAPAVGMTAPANGATVNGTVTLAANATDNMGVTGVQFKLDGVNLGGAMTGAGPVYSYSWNTATAANGTHTLTVVAGDAAGNTTTSAAVSVTVNNVAADTTAPAVSMTAPANGASVNGTVTVTANATDNVGVTGVQFKLDGANLGSVVTGAGPAFSYSWNTATAANGIHTLTAVASDAAGNSASSGSVSVTVANNQPLVVSGVSVGAIGSSSAIISWATDRPADSQVAYGATASYGSLSPLAAGLVTSHTVTLGGLTPATVYHYQVLSRDGSGNAGSSADLSFTTTAAGASSMVLQIQGEAAEVSGTVVTPAVAPVGFAGTLMKQGSGSVHYAAAHSGNGVYFQNCCDNTNVAYYRFTGAGVGSIFNVDQGQITFYLKSRYGFAQRQSSATSPRFAFDVREGGSGSHLFYFTTRVNAGSLLFSYAVGAGAQFYYVPKGSEESLFGNGGNDEGHH